MAASSGRPLSKAARKRREDSGGPGTGDRNRRPARAGLALRRRSTAGAPRGPDRSRRGMQRHLRLPPRRKDLPRPDDLVRGARVPSAPCRAASAGSVVAAVGFAPRSAPPRAGHRRPHRTRLRHRHRHSDHAPGERPPQESRRSADAPRRRSRFRRYAAPGMLSSSSVSMVPPQARCGCPARTALSASSDSACRIE